MERNYSTQERLSPTACPSPGSSGFGAAGPSILSIILRKGPQPRQADHVPHRLFLPGDYYPVPLHPVGGVAPVAGTPRSRELCRRVSAISLLLCQTGEGLPVGVPFAAPFGREVRRIRQGSFLEKANPWAVCLLTMHVGCPDPAVLEQSRRIPGQRPLHLSSPDQLQPLRA